VTVICCVVEFWLVLASFATTVMRLAPTFNETWALQLAVPEPLTEPPVAALPFTVTDEMPLFPNPESLAVPETVRVLIETVAPLAGLLMVTFGAWVSGGVTRVKS